jgi:hypothetical protein
MRSLKYHNSDTLFLPKMGLTKSKSFEELLEHVVKFVLDSRPDYCTLLFFFKEYKPLSHLPYRPIFPEITLFSLNSN